MAAKKKRVAKKPVQEVVQRGKYNEILFNENPRELIAEADKWIDKGWQISGAAGFSSKGYFYTMVKRNG